MNLIPTSSATYVDIVYSVVEAVRVNAFLDVSEIFGFSKAITEYPGRIVTYTLMRFVKFVLKETCLAKFWLVVKRGEFCSNYFR